MTADLVVNRVETLTVMFTDLVDSTGIRVQVGEETAEQLRQRHDKLVRAAVAAHSGRVAKHTGDGVMAVFDGAADAIAAAVGIQQDIDWDNRRGNQGVAVLRIRIGVSAGDVSLEGEDCFGLPVVEAQRLESCAQPGQILVSTVVSILARGRGSHELRPVGALELKGLDAPVDAQEVIWAPRAPEAALPARLAEEGAFPFAGRTKESELLSEAWSAAASGGTQLVLVSGEPGIGKTRLAAQAASTVVDKGGLVLAGHCDELVGAPYQPFAEALRHRLSRSDGVDSLGAAGGELAHLVPELDRLLPGLAGPLVADPEAGRLRLFEATRSWLAELAMHQPVMLVLDDLHWAEAGTLLLMRHLVVNEAVPRLLMLGTYRDTDLDRTHPLAGMLGEFRRRPDVRRISLNGLDAAEISELMTEAAGHDLAEQGTALAATVQAETAGNPFFVGEVLRHLVESGAIVQTDGRWRAEPSTGQRLLPEGIREVVGRRVSLLTEDTQRTLSAAAVIGSEFALDVLEVASGRSDAELIDALESAVAARLVIEDGIDRYRFAHALVRQTLHDELSTSRRARLHRSVAEALESLHAADLDAVTPELAYHWAEAGPAPGYDQAVAYSIRAGELAERRVAPEEAARWYGQARDLLDASDPRLDAELATRAAQAMTLAGMSGWREALHQAGRAAEVLGDAALMAETLCTSRRMLVAEGSPEGDDPEKIELLERALALCPEQDRMLWARLSGALVAELVVTGDRDRRAGIFQAVMDHAWSLEDAMQRFEVIQSVAVGRPGSIRTRAEYLRLLPAAIEAAELAAAGGDLSTEANARFLVSMLQVHVGSSEHRGAVAAYTELLERYPHPLHQDWLAELQMRQAVIDGLPTEVEARARKSLRQMTAHGRGAGAAISFGSGMLQASREQVGLEPLLDFLKGSPMYAEAKPNVIQAIVALTLAEAGSHGEARSLIDELGRGGFADIPDDAGVPVAQSCWAEAAALVGHPEGCRALYARMLSCADLHQANSGWYLGATARYLGLLSDALGRSEDADEWYAMAEAEHSEIQSPPWLARGLLDWALSRQRRGQSGEARALAAKALNAIGGLDLVVSRSRATRLLQETTG